jgi:RimJ/RimL family protein N-acetyltransferase
MRDMGRRTGDEEEVRLRPVEETDLSLLERLLTESPEMTGEFAWFGFYEPGLRALWAANRLLTDERSALIVARGGESLGFVSWRKQWPSRNAYFFVFGISLLPKARGKGYGSEAQRLLVRYLFAHTPVHRIQADTEVDNVAEQRALEKAGFTREGVIRGVVWRDGAWRDGVVYSVLRTDTEADGG